MFWPNSLKSIALLEKLVEAHREYVTAGNPMPDDKVLNELISAEGKLPEVYLLPRARFVIGHRIFALVAQLRGFTLDEAVCYHANYATVEGVKLNRMKACSLRQFQYSRRLFFLLTFVIHRKLTN